MEVQFYGHVRQYLNHKEEFDKAIQDVLMAEFIPSVHKKS